MVMLSAMGIQTSSVYINPYPVYWYITPYPVYWYITPYPVHMQESIKLCLELTHPDCIMD